MTREEFFEEVSCFDELLEFCSDHDIDICEDVYDGDFVLERIVEIARNHTASNALDAIYGLVMSIDDFDEYYFQEISYTEFRSLGDEEFEAFKRDVADDYETMYGWDDDDDDDESWDYGDDTWQEDSSEVDENVDIEAFNQLVTPCKSS